MAVIAGMMIARLYRRLPWGVSTPHAAKKYKDQEDEVCDKAMQRYMPLAMERI